MYYKNEYTNLYYEKYGSRKQTILILPGWGDNRKTFYYLINFLKQYFTVYIIDYPSFGNSTINKELTIFNYSDIIYNFINFLNINNPILIGHSFGGRIISLLLTKYKLKAKKILLIDVAGLKYINIKLIIKTIIYKVLKLLKLFLPTKIKIKYQKYLFNKFASDDYKNINTTLFKTFKNIIKVNLKKYYKKINIETLIIWGELDDITPIHLGIKLHKLIKNSTLIKIKNSYHFPYLDRPTLTNNIIYYYLKKDIIES